MENVPQSFFESFRVIAAHSTSHAQTVKKFFLKYTVELGYNVIEGTTKIMTLCPSDVIKESL